MGEINNIRALIENATAGEWATSEADPGVVVDSTGQPIAVFGGGPQSYRDAAFTAAARNTIGLLLDRIVELEDRSAEDRHG
ncbi:hypothetical protein ACFY9G_22960 [Streptomyces anthocyanicus]|uniref:hypothetical protein n=1 Tax=Streptomyces anthocyanicus TaxID=68174 RepID=UPI0036ECDEF2